MILNNREYKTWREGITVQEIIDENRFTWPKLVVKLNRKVVWPEEYTAAVVAESDNLEIIHLLGGG